MQPKGSCGKYFETRVWAYSRAIYQALFKRRLSKPTTTSSLFHEYSVQRDIENSGSSWTQSPHTVYGIPYSFYYTSARASQTTPHHGHTLLKSPLPTIIAPQSYFSHIANYYTLVLCKINFIFWNNEFKQLHIIMLVNSLYIRTIWRQIVKTRCTRVSVTRWSLMKAWRKPQM